MEFSLEAIVVIYLIGVLTGWTMRTGLDRYEAINKRMHRRG